MKKVALISDGWKRYFIYAWPHGIMETVSECEEDVCLYHYNCHGNLSSEKLHNQGEYNIYNLPDLKEFDGIIFESNNILDEDVVNHVLDLIDKSGVPAVSIGRDFEKLYYAGIDEKEPITTIVDHMYEVHGSRSFVYTGGPEAHYGNRCRVEAYTACMEKYGLSVEDNPVFYGDYEFAGGEKFFKSYIASGRELPDVFICACDNVAAGICTQAERMGYKVPEDFKITGFDNLDKAAYFRPQITTVSHNRGVIASKAMQVLIDIWSGKQIDKYNFVETQCIFSESCGCPNSGIVDYREYMRDQIIYGVQKAKDEEATSELESAMTTYTRYQDLYECMGEFLKGFECAGYFVVVDDALTLAKGRSSMTTKGYNMKNLSVVYARDEERKLKFASVDDLNAYIERTGKNCQYTFHPIHFRQYTVGYTIMKNARFLYDYSFYYDLHNILVKGLESLYAHNKIESANKKLKEIYNKDQLTGIYNRIAYAETIAPAFTKYYNQGTVCAVGFIDVDKFKQINDTYGHEYGDEVLKNVASILQRKCPKTGYVCRYGGDEFIIFFPYADEKSAAEVKESINEAAAEIDVKLSIGMVLSSDDYGSDISAYFEVADKYMYEEKQRHKKSES